MSIGDLVALKPENPVMDWLAPEPRDSHKAVIKVLVE